MASLQIAAKDVVLMGLPKVNGLNVGSLGGSELRKLVMTRPQGFKQSDFVYSLEKEPTETKLFLFNVRPAQTGLAINWYWDSGVRFLTRKLRTRISQYPSIPTPPNRLVCTWNLISRTTSFEPQILSIWNSDLRFHEWKKMTFWTLMAGIFRKNFNPVSQIRILVLDAGELNAPISARFMICDVFEEREVSWEAVSYTWDDQVPSKEIELEGVQVKVTRNVFRILRDLRLRSAKRNIWVDAVCIAQGNAAEKAGQVPLMRHIYKKAAAVLIWLDIGGNEDAAAAVASCARWLESKTEGFPETETKELQHLFIGENPNCQMNAPFHRMLTSRWFQRIWVVQEAVLATDLRVYLGRDMLQWDVFASTILRFITFWKAPQAMRSTLDECYDRCRHRDYSVEMRLGVSMLHLIFTLRTVLQSPYPTMSPSELVLLCKDLRATIPSDMIFGLMALFGSGHATTPPTSGPISIAVDYGLPRMEVYKNFTTWCIQTERTLDVLAQQRNENGGGGCSWTTDWYDKYLGDFGITETSPLMSRLKSAPLPATPTLSPQVQRLGNVLFVRGFIFDDFVGDKVDHLFNLNCELTSEVYQKWLQKIQSDEHVNRLLFNEPHVTGETLERLYAQTSKDDLYVSHLWRDGERSDIAVRKEGAAARLPFVTQRGCLAFTFPYFSPPAKICYLLGGRGLFVLKPVTIEGSEGTFYKLVSGDCFIRGFEDGKGYDLCLAMGLQIQDFFLI